MSVRLWSRFFPSLRPQTALLVTTVVGIVSLARPQVTTAQSLFRTNGNASASTTCTTSGFTLTPNEGGKSGSVWRLQQVTLAKSFVFRFSVYLGTNDGNGGDGMTFALQRSANGVTALGGGGQNMGMAAISPSLTVEFDTYDNGTGIGDISADHLAIIKNGQFGQPVSFTTPAGNTATAIAAVVNSNGGAQNIENGTYYPVIVTWNVNSKQLQVYFNGALRATYSEDVVTTVFGNNPLVYWGFTASTGGAFNKQEVCNPTVEYDQDSDGITDQQDADDDNDGLADVLESNNADATGDADQDGVLNYQDADFGALNANSVVRVLDADGDGLINQFDLDSDSDGLPDVIEGTTAEMSADFRASYSAALGRYSTAVDATGRPQTSATYTTVPDTDSDSIPDYLDTNSDQDAYPDWVEAFDDNRNGQSVDDFQARARAFVQAGGSSTFYPMTVSGNSGGPNWLKDDNQNGVPNFLDLASSFYHDTDGDGLVDLLDPSSMGTGYAEVAGIPDRNSNGVPDHREALVATPLPVELVSFTVHGVGPQVQLTWTTASERNSAYFVIESSREGTAFQALGRVAATGTTTLRQTYHYVDTPVAPKYASVIYYRLRQVDQDGTETLTPIRTLRMEPATISEGLQLVPNPAHGQVSLLYTADNMAWELLDLTGRVLRHHQGPAPLSLTGLATGVYVVRQGTRTVRLVVE